MTSIAQAYVEILPSARGMGNALRGELGGMESTMGTSARRGFMSGFSNLAGPLAAVIGGLGIGTAISNSIAAASDLSETRSAVATVFGDANAEVQAFADGAASALGQTQQQALEGARTFGIFGQAAGLQGGDLADFSTDLVGLAADFASFNNVDPEQATQAIAAGLRGESEPLRQFGILLDDAALKARAMEMGIYDGNGALTQQQRVMAAQAEIFAQAGSQAGDFERTSGGLANQQRILQASWGDLSATIGTVFLPIATEVVSFINEHIMPALSDFAGMLSGGGIAGALEGLAGARGAFFDASMAALPGLVDGFVAMLPQIVAFITGTLIPQLVSEFTTLVTVVLDVLTQIIPQLAAMLPGLVQALLTMIPALITALLGAVPQLLTGALAFFMALLDALVLIIPQLLTTIVQMLPVIIQTLVAMLPTLIDAAINFFFALITALLETIPVLLVSIIGMLPQIVTTLVGLIPVLIDAAILLFSSLLDGLLENIPLILDMIVNDMIPAIVGAIIEAAPQLLDAGVALIQAFINGIGSMLGAVGDAVGGIIDFVAGFFPNSPAKHGPLSGAGWRAIGKSGGAIEDAFSAGFTGRIDDVLTSGVPVPRVPVSAEVAGYAASVGGAPFNVNVSTSAALDDPYLVAQVTGNAVSRALGGK